MASRKNTQSIINAYTTIFFFVELVMYKEKGNSGSYPYENAVISEFRCIQFFLILFEYYFRLCEYNRNYGLFCRSKSTVYVREIIVFLSFWPLSRILGSMWPQRISSGGNIVEVGLQWRWQGYYKGSDKCIISFVVKMRWFFLTSDTILIFYAKSI